MSILAHDVTCSEREGGIQGAQAMAKLVAVEILTTIGGENPRAG